MRFADRNSLPLEISDVMFQSGLVMDLRRSKTYQEAMSLEVRIPRGDGEATCPVPALNLANLSCLY